MVTIGGYGTSPVWSELFTRVQTKNFKIKIDSSGTGPSDHTSFYRKDIPVLFFFTGLHSDYHKPSDDANRINYTGTLYIVNYITSLIEKSSLYSIIPFLKTREQQTGTSTRFTVSLGIMPDYTFTGPGVRVDGVSEGKLAKSIGILAGDVLINLGANRIDSVESYMQSLSKFKKGDKTTLTVLRGDKEITYNIVFQ
jgi:C-terminal processing protease CtpA/Prc